MPNPKDLIEIILYLAITAALLAALQSCAATATATATENSRPKPGTVEFRSNHHRQLIYAPNDTVIFYGKKIMFIISPGADSFTARYYEDLK